MLAYLHGGANSTFTVAVSLFTSLLCSFLTNL